MKTITNFFRITSQSATIVIIVFFVGFASCKKDSSMNANSNAKVNYSGTFVKSSDAVTTAATGTVTGTFDPATMTLAYSITWSGLGSNVAAMHFHDNGPVIDEITGFSATASGTLTGTVTFINTQVADLQAGKIYVQIHSVNIPGGEIKATLTTSSNTTYNPGSSGGYGY